MKIGDIVYVVTGASYGGPVLTEVEVCSEQRQVLARGCGARKTTGFSGKPLRSFHLDKGWLPSSRKGPFTYLYKRVFSSKEAVYQSVQDSLETMKQSAESSIKVAEANVAYAIKQLQGCQEHKARLDNFDSNSFWEKPEHYISPFTGKEV